MSATASTIVVPRSASPADTRATRPRLVPSPAPRRARTGIFVAFVLAILTTGLLGMLWVNTALAQGAFAVSDLQQRQARLIEVEQQLRDDLARAEAPSQLEAAARALGMVPQDFPVFLRLSDGAIIGEPIPQPMPMPPADVPVVDTGEVSTDLTTQEPTAGTPLESAPAEVDE